MAKRKKKPMFVFVLIGMLMLISIFVLLHSTQNNKIVTINPDITFFLKRDTSDKKLQQFVKELSKQKGVKKINTLTPQEGFKQYTENNKDNKIGEESIKEDKFPAVIEVTLSDIHKDYQQSIATWAKTKSSLEGIFYNHASYE